MWVYTVILNIGVEFRLYSVVLRDYHREAELTYCTSRFKFLCHSLLQVGSLWTPDTDKGDV